MQSAADAEPGEPDDEQHSSDELDFSTDEEHEPPICWRRQEQMQLLKKIDEALPLSQSYRRSWEHSGKWDEPPAPLAILSVLVTCGAPNYSVNRISQAVGFRIYLVVPRAFV